MRQFPILTDPNKAFVYARLRGITWSATGLVYLNHIQAAAGAMLATIVHGLSSGQRLLVNCRGVNKIDDYALEPLIAAIRERLGTITVVFIEMRESLFDDLRHMLPTTLSNFTATGEKVEVIVCGAPLSGVSADELCAFAADLESSTVAKWIGDAFVENNGGKLERLSSTPILASGAFNARRLVRDPLSFVWLSLLLAEKLQRSARPQRLHNPRILAASLRSSPFAAAVSELTDPGLDLEIVDHLGPRFSILETEFAGRIAEPADYIFCGDFILLGTELKLAQNYAYHRRAKLDFAIALGQLLPSAAYSDKLHLESLQLLPNCKPDARYTVLDAR